MKKIIHKIDKARIRFVKIEFALLMTILVLLALVFSKPEVIGYASTSIHSQDLNLALEQSQSFYLISNGVQPIHLTSLTISGNIIGPGTASIYLDNERGTRYLVYRNTKRLDSTHNRITGTAFTTGLSVTGSTLPAKEERPVLDLLEGTKLQAFEALPQGYKAIEGQFNNACIDSCLLHGDLFFGERFKLDFYTEPGTSLVIKEIVYTTLEDI